VSKNLFETLGISGSLEKAVGIRRRLYEVFEIPNMVLETFGVFRSL
jgi:hypothetical protein